MSAKCAICKRAFVNEPGQVCITCKMRQQTCQTVQIQSQQTEVIPMQKEVFQEQTVNRNIRQGAHSYTGIVQNIHQREMKQGIMRRWFTSLAYGNPFVFSDTQYEFSLYLQGNYTAERVQGKEVVFYGNPGYCFLNNNSTVNVYGVMDRNGVILAKEISGINTSFRMKPRYAIPGIVVRLLSIALLIAIIVTGIHLGTMGTAEAVEAETTGDTLNTGNSLFAVICLVCAGIIIKLKIPKRFLIAIILTSVGLFFVEPVLSCIIWALLLFWKAVKRK